MYDTCKANVRRVGERNYHAILNSTSCRYEQKNAELKLGTNEQHEVLKRREKHTMKYLLASDGRQLGDQLNNVTVFAAFQSLNDGDNAKCSISPVSIRWLPMENSETTQSSINSLESIVKNFTVKFFMIDSSAKVQITRGKRLEFATKLTTST